MVVGLTRNLICGIVLGLGRPLLPWLGRVIGFVLDFALVLILVRGLIIGLGFCIVFCFGIVLGFILGVGPVLALRVGLG